MVGFNLPITIESRKIIHLDLQENSEFNEEDTFIISSPETKKQRTIVAISKDRTLQSIVDDEEDISLSDIKFNFDIKSKNSISININLKEKNQSNDEDEKNNHDLEFIETNEDFRINIKGTQKPESDPITLIFNYKSKNEKIYSKQIKIHTIEKKEIYFAGLDFGSEASQIIEGKYRYSDLEYNFVDLFGNIKKNAEASLKSMKNEEFEQYENEVGHKLFKSIFYSKKSIDVIDNKKPFKNSLKILTPKQIEDHATFNKEFQQIPNLKLIYNSAFAESIKFNLNYPESNKNQNLNLKSVQEDIYGVLLDEILTSFLKNQIIQPSYVRFTVLVPNIYTIDEIKNTKKIIREIFNQYNIKSKNILGLEITSISESDAAFQGCNGYLKQENSKSYYICIDCGKGTTDFSIISSKDSLEFVPIFRNGFAGAGNLISYAIFESIKSFLYNELDLTSESRENLIQFLDTNLKMGEYFIKRLYDKIEYFKKNYKNDLSYEEINEHWKNAKSKNLTFEKFFSSKEVESDGFFALLDEVEYINDWGNFIESAYIDISNEIEKNISKVIDNLSQSNPNLNVSAVIMTGRGFLFKPLSNFLTKKLSNNKYLKNTNYINNTTNNFDLKEICLQGIFTPNIKIHNDLVNTPIEININNFEQNSGRRKNILTKILTFINKVPDVLFGPQEYNLESNTLNVIENEISKIRFLIGGKIFVPDISFLLSSITKFDESRVICSRDGFYLIGTYSDKKIILPLIKSINSVNPPEILERVQKSLFPIYFNNKK